LIGLYYFSFTGFIKLIGLYFALLQDLLILLDLIGTATPKFRNWFQKTDRYFERMKKIGKFEGEKWRGVHM
jgi:hypothetical protein